MIPEAGTISKVPEVFMISPLETLTSLLLRLFSCNEGIIERRSVSTASLSCLGNFPHGRNKLPRVGLNILGLEAHLNTGSASVLHLRAGGRE